MYNFPQIPPTIKSLAFRGLVCGIGINDADYLTNIIIDGDRLTCPIYQTWSCMIKRCYSEVSLSNDPTYQGCSVSDGWRRFSNFKAWMLMQDFDGKALDKDILFSGNKVYSSVTCLLVTNEINSLLNDHRAARGSLPIGVRKLGNKYQARCNANGKSKCLGCFDTPEKAHAAYLKFKSNHVHEIALRQSDPRLKAALIRISGEIARGEYYT